MIQKKKFSDAIAANISVVGELIKPTFNAVDWGVFNIYYKGIIQNETKQTEIKGNPGFSGTKAFCYIASTFSADGDNTQCEFGIVRLGYDNSKATKSIIKQSSGSVANVNIDFSISEAGFVQITTTHTTPLKVLCWG